MRNGLELKVRCYGLKGKITLVVDDRFDSFWCHSLLKPFLRRFEGARMGIIKMDCAFHGRSEASCSFILWEAFVFSDNICSLTHMLNMSCI